MSYDSEGVRHKVAFKVNALNCYCLKPLKFESALVGDAMRPMEQQGKHPKIRSVQIPQFGQEALGMISTHCHGYPKRTGAAWCNEITISHCYGYSTEDN